MPVSTTFQQRTTSDVVKSTMAASATTSVGVRHKGFPARKRGDSSLAGGDIVVATITLNPTSKTLAAAGTQKITATIKNAAGEILPDEVITWASDAQSKATVDSTGLVTAVATGSANITAQVSPITSSACVITVS